MTDNVNHPQHYTKEGRKECIVEMVEKYGEVPVYWFCMISLSCMECSMISGTA